MKTPKHFDSGLTFKIHILECALRDRKAYQEAIRGCEGVGWDEMLDEVAEEICEMRRGLQELKAKESREVDKPPEGVARSPGN